MRLKLALYNVKDGREYKKKGNYVNEMVIIKG